jgi:hypothetical protein
MQKGELSTPHLQAPKKIGTVLREGAHYQYDADLADAKRAIRLSDDDWGHGSGGKAYSACDTTGG